MFVIRTLMLLAVVGGAFVGGFQAGLWYRDEQIREKPEEILKIYGEEVRKDAAEKFDRIKAILLE